MKDIIDLETRDKMILEAEKRIADGEEIARKIRADYEEQLKVIAAEREAISFWRLE